jgi:hypothetical protein
MLARPALTTILIVILGACGSSSPCKKACKYLNLCMAETSGTSGSDRLGDAGSTAEPVTCNFSDECTPLEECQAKCMLAAPAPAGVCPSGMAARSPWTPVCQGTGRCSQRTRPFPPTPSRTAASPSVRASSADLMAAAACAVSALRPNPATLRGNASRLPRAATRVRSAPRPIPPAPVPTRFACSWNRGPPPACVWESVRILETPAPCPTRPR